MTEEEIKMAALKIAVGAIEDAQADYMGIGEQVEEADDLDINLIEVQLGLLAKFLERAAK